MKILLVDDHHAVRRAIRSLLKAHSDWTVCGEAVDGVEAVEKARSLRPDVILMDISMPRMDGVEATRILRRELPAIDIIIVSQNDPGLVLRQAAGLGARAVVQKAHLSRTLVPAIDKIAAGRKSLPGNFAGDTRTVQAQDLSGDRWFRDAFDALPAAVYITDPGGRLTYFNSAAIELSGHVPHVGSDKWCVSWKLFRADGTALPHDQCPMAVALREGRSVYGEEIIAERPDRTRRWLAPFPTPLRDADGKVVGGINMLVDITDRKRGEQTSNLLAAIVDCSDDAIISKNLDGIITSWNKGAERIFGYSAAEAIGQNVTLIIPPSRRQEETEILSRLRRGERVDHFDTVRRRKDGTLIDVSLTISPVRDSAGKVLGASKVARDISERKRAEATLANAVRQQQALFRLADRLHRAATLNDVYESAMNSICDAVQCDRASILLCDPQGVTRFAGGHGLSEKYCKTLAGHSPWKADEQDPRPVTIEDIDAVPITAELRRTVKAETIEALAFIPLVSQYRLIGKLMACFPAVHHFTNEELELCMTIARQVAFAMDRKQSEEQLRSSEERFRNLSERLDAEVRARTSQLEQTNTDLLRQSWQVRELSRRLLQAQDEERRHIARELHDSAGQTLTVLGINLAELLEKAKARDPELAELVRASEEIVQQLHQDIRTTSYLLHPPLLDELGLASALAWYAQGLSERSTLVIHLDIAEDFGRIPRDMELVVFRLVQECLTNIHRHANAKNAWLRVARLDDGISVEVADDGKGMSAERLAEVQSAVSGVGIRGMRERVRQLQGELKIESNSSGTKILVTIPITPSVDEESTADPQETAA